MEECHCRSRCRAIQSLNNLGNFGANEYLDFFCRVAESVDLPLAVQNAPQYLGRSLSDKDVAKLRQRNHQFSHIKAETSAVELATLINSCSADMTVLNGRAGLEFTDCLRAGCAGFILAPDTIDYTVAAFNQWQAGQLTQAEETYARFLPATVFMMQSLEQLICYGKRIFGARTGMDIHDRGPAQRPTALGDTLVKHWASWLGPFGISSVNNQST